MKWFVLPVLAMSITTPALADDKPCQKNYVEEGSFLAGRRFSSWDVVPAVTVEQAYRRIYTEGVKSGLTVASADKDIGIISFAQANAGVTNTGAQVTVPWNVTLEEVEGGVKVAVVKTTPGGYATSEDFQITSMCAVIDAARP